MWFTLLSFTLRMFSRCVDIDVSSYIISPIFIRGYSFIVHLFIFRPMSLYISFFSFSTVFICHPFRGSILALTFFLSALPFHQFLGRLTYLFLNLNTGKRMAGLGPEQRGSAEEGGADVNSAGQRLLQLTQGHTVGAVGDADPVLDIVVPDVLERCRESLFPEVLPQDAHPVNVRSTSAWDLLTWVHRTEHIRIAEYMNERYYIFRCHSGERSEGDDWLRAKWARTFFYVHLAEYLESGRVKLHQITSVFRRSFHRMTFPCVTEAMWRRYLMPSETHRCKNAQRLWSRIGSSSGIACPALALEKNRR